MHISTIIHPSVMMAQYLMLEWNSYQHPASLEFYVGHADNRFLCFTTVSPIYVAATIILYSMYRIDMYLIIYIKCGISCNLILQVLTLLEYITRNEFNRPRSIVCFIILLMVVNLNFINGWL